MNLAEHMMTTNVTPSFTSNTTIRLQFKQQEVDDRPQAKASQDTSPLIDALPLWEISSEAGIVSGSPAEFIALQTSDLTHLLRQGTAQQAEHMSFNSLAMWSVKVNGVEVPLTSASLSEDVLSSVDTGWFLFDFASTRTVLLTLSLIHI